MPHMKRMDHVATLGAFVAILKVLVLLVLGLRPRDCYLANV